MMNDRLVMMMMMKNRKNVDAFCSLKKKFLIEVRFEVEREKEFKPSDSFFLFFIEQYE